MSEESHRFLQERSNLLVQTLREQLLAQENEIALMSAELARYRQIEQCQARRHELNERWMREFNAPSAVKPYWQFELIDFIREKAGYDSSHEIFFTTLIQITFGKEGLDLLNEIMDLQDRIVKLECGE
jgi:hypothetical protein